MDNLKEKFISRKYPQELVDEQFQKARKKDRKKLIFQERKNNQKEDKKVRFIFTHNRGNPPLHKWIRESRKFLVSPKCKEFGKNFQVAYKQPRNLRKIVSGCKKIEGDEGVNDTPQVEAGCHKCNKCRVACPILVETNQFKSTNRQKTYCIRQHMTCNSSYVLYLATCKKCKGQYVGKWQTSFKTRHSNHKQEIKQGRGGLGQHYGPKANCSYQDISIILIEQVEIGNKAMLAKREQYWQHQLRAFIENGGNAHSIKKEFT